MNIPIPDSLLDTDFVHSFVQWRMDVMDHSPRCALKARCSVSLGGRTETYHLFYPCAGEEMYVERNLIHQPTAEFHGVVSDSGGFLLVKHFADPSACIRSAQRVGCRFPSHDGRGCVITSVDKHLRTFACVERLHNDHEVYEACVKNIPIIARTAFSVLCGAESAGVIAEYPVTVMNAHHGTHQWQVDTGPILLPDPETDATLGLASMREAFIVYNHFDYAEFALRRPVVTEQGVSAIHFGPPNPIECQNQLFAVRAF
jgi:hypothetical protein